MSAIGAPPIGVDAWQLWQLVASAWVTPHGIAPALGAVVPGLLPSDGLAGVPSPGVGVVAGFTGAPGAAPPAAPVTVGFEGGVTARGPPVVPVVGVVVAVDPVAGVSTGAGPLATGSDPHALRHKQIADANPPNACCTPRARRQRIDSNVLFSSVAIPNLVSDAHAAPVPAKKTRPGPVSETSKTRQIELALRIFFNNFDGLTRPTGHELTELGPAAAFVPPARPPDRKCDPEDPCRRVRRAPARGEVLHAATPASDRAPRACR
jgi:hypothetical protein